MLVRILIVDDDQPMVEMLKGLMQPMASYIDSTDNLAHAIEMAKVGKFNLILFDLKLIGTGKDEALNAIRHLKEDNAVVVVVSGLPQPNLKNEVMAAGADAFVPKDGTSMTRALLLAANVAIMHLPRESFKSDSFSEHIQLLDKLAHA